MLLERVGRFIEEHQLLPPAQSVVVGVSGGPDSLVLLHILSRLKARGLTLHVAHLNHRLRGAEAEADARFVQGFARQLGLPCTVGSADVKALQSRNPQSVETAARQLRYAFLRDVANRIGAERVVVGHTADDQAETVTMHWLRGSGIAGLRGMRPAAPIFLLDEQAEPVMVEGDEVEAVTSPASPHLLVVRPLLNVWRKEVEAYCRQHDLKPRTDSSNGDPRHQRNKVRLQLIPALETFNPDFRENITRAAQTYAVEYDYFESQVDALWPQLAEVGDGLVRFNGEVWQQTALALQPYCLRRAVLTLVGHVEGLERVHIEAIVGGDGPARARVQLPHELLMQREVDGFVIGLRDGLEERLRALDSRRYPLLPNPAPLTFNPPCDMTLNGWHITAAWEPPPADPTTTDRWEAWLDVSEVPLPLTLRGRASGERIEPLGLQGQSKSLQDLMVDAKVPAHVRTHWPLLVGGQEEDSQVVWAVGLTVSELARVRPDSRVVLHIRFERSRD